MVTVKKGRKPKGLPKRTGSPVIAAKTRRHFTRALDKKYRRVLKREGLAKAEAWKLARIQKAVAGLVAAIK